MKRLLSTIALTLLATISLCAGVEGKWIAETKRPGKNKRGKETVTVVFDLRSDGDKLMGSVAAGGRKAQPMEITEGKIAGNSFSFKTMQKSKKKGEVEVEWKGTIEDEQLKLTRSLRGGKRSQELVAKRP